MEIDYEVFKIISQIIIISFIASLFLSALFRYLRIRNMVPRSLSMITLSISVPREVKPITEEAKKEEKDIISVAEQMYSNLYAIKKGGLASLLYGPDFISIETVSRDGSIYFYVSVPRKYANYIEKIIHSQYPKALIKESGDYNMFKPGYFVKGAYVKMAKKNYFPIKTYQKMEADPMDAITNSLSKLSEDEGAAIQIIIRPASKKWMLKGRKIAKEMIQKGKTLNEATSPFFVKMFANSKTPDPLTFFSKPQEPRSQDTPDRISQMQEEFAKILEEKSNKLGFETCIRIITSAKTAERAEMNLENLKGAFTQYTIPSLNNFIIKIQSKRKMHKFIAGFIFRYFKGGLLPSMKNILNTEELTSIFHLPTKFTETPNIDWLLAKDAPPPPNLPKEGLLLGKTNYRGDEKEVRISNDDRRRHMYIIGQTGTGKSVFLQNMIIQDIKDGKGCCVIDPHGDLVDGVLPHIPKERADDIVLFEPFDTERPMGLNMLEFKSPEQKDFAVQEMINIFYKLFPPEMIGPMFEHNMRNVMLTLMSDKEEPGTIVEIPRMFSDQEFADSWVKKLDDPVVRAFWEKEMAKTSDFHKSEMLGYLISKVGKFVENEMMRNIMGQNHSAFDLRDIMDNEKVLLVNLSKGRTGEVNSELLGLIIVSKIQMAAMGRADMPEADRKDFYLYVDEFQNFATDSFASILAEARKYRLNLIVAHQYITQLEEEIRDAVFGNVGSFITFRIGVEDAEVIAKEFDPIFSETDVINIERFHAYLRLMTKSQKSTPFTMGTYPPYEGGSKEIAEAIKQLSRLKFGRDKKIVNAEIMERAQLGTQNVKVNEIERTM